MRSLISSLSILFSIGLCAQEIPNLSGEWKGNSNFLSASYRVTTIISQTGDKIEGYTVSVSTSGKDSTKVRFTGEVVGTTVKFYPEEFIYKTNATECMSNSVLSFSQSGSELSLIGRWKGDLSLKTCPPGIAGGLSLYRTDEKYAQSSKADETYQVEATDGVGIALVNELSRRKYHALIIGIDSYPDDKIQNLDQPVKDGGALADVLINEYTFERSDVKVLTNPTRGEIIEALDQLSATVTDKDNLLIFYAGHGVWNEQLNQGYWLPSDASMNSKSNWLSNSTIRDYVGGIRSKHTLLISDACFSGGILKERAVFENSRAALELYKLPSRKAMTSGTLKTVPDKSVFIEYLVKNLKKNAAPLLSADQLFRDFKIAVINNSPNGQVPQYGPITQAGDEGGDFIFLKKR